MSENAATDEDQREKEIRTMRNAILKAHFGAFTPSSNAVIALEQAIHMILAGV